MRPFLILTCEHATSRVPEEWASDFEADAATLRSHRGWDPGAVEVAESIAEHFGAPLFAATWSRLLVDANRSLGHRQLHSEYTRRWMPERREALLQATYVPFRNSVADAIRTVLDAGREAIHLSCHSFTRELRGKRRRTDVGLLYDPRVPAERAIVQRLRAGYRLAGRLRGVHLNLPYRGTSDGHTTSLRAQFGPLRYRGLELEVCQDVIAQASPDRDQLIAQTLIALEHAFAPAGAQGTP